LRGLFSAVSKPNFAIYLEVVNTRLKALDEFFKIYNVTLLHRSEFQNSTEFRQACSHVCSRMSNVECRMSNVECRKWSENALNPVKSPFSAYLM